jgi:cell wall-associated NlpC family hydrolase
LTVSAARLRALALAIVTTASMLSFAPATLAASPSNADTAAHGSKAAKVIYQAKRHIGVRFRLGATGPSRFDCSGLMYRSFKDAGLLSVIGGRRMRARQYYAYFRHKGLTSRGSGHAGDLVVYTHRGAITHIGMYLGNAKVLSAIRPRVAIHRINGVTAHFYSFLHTGLSHR